MDTIICITDEGANIEYTPVQDTIPLVPKPSVPFNLIDALSESAPSTSTACQNHCPPEKPKRAKTPKFDQTLIVFSSTSSSEETVPQANNKIMAVKEIQCEIGTELSNIKIEGMLPKKKKNFMRKTSSGESYYSLSRLGLKLSDRRVRLQSEVSTPNGS